MELFLETWTTEVQGQAKLYLGLALVYALLLGWSSYTDLFQNKTIPNTASMGLIFASLAAAPFLYQDLGSHFLWSGILVLFFFFIFFLGAIADGDLKIYVAFAILLGPAALLAALISWFIIILYSLPLIYSSLRDDEKKTRGKRLGIAPAAPGIALSFPLTLLLLGVDLQEVALFSLAMVACFLFSWVLYRFDARAMESISEEE